MKGKKLVAILSDAGLLRTVSSPYISCEDTYSVGLKAAISGMLSTGTVETMVAVCSIHRHLTACPAGRPQHTPEGTSHHRAAMVCRQGHSAVG